MFAPLMLLAQHGATELWPQESHPWLFELAQIGPWLLVAALGVLIVRALLRHRRYVALSVLTEKDREDVRTALKEAEARTSGEIVPVVLERSDEHPHAIWAWFVIAFIAGSVLLEAHLSWLQPQWLIAQQLALGCVGLLLASWLPDLRRLVVSNARADEMATEQAFQEFYRLGVHQTQAHTGILLFVSLFERRVIVLGDEGIDAKVDPEEWNATREAILAGIRKGSLRDGLIEGIKLSGKTLAQHFPAAKGDVNELPNRLVVRKW